MKILAVAHNTRLSGGANRSFLSVLANLKTTYNADILVLVPRSKGKFVDELEKQKIPWIQLSYFGIISSYKEDKKDFLRLLKVHVGYWLETVQAHRLYRKLRNEKFDVVYTNTRLPYLGAKFAKLTNTKHVVHVREFGGEQPIWGKWGDKELYKYSDKIILISEALKKRFQQNVPTDKLITVHNGIDTTPVDNRYLAIGNDQEVHMILTGRLVPDKGQSEAIKAMIQLQNEDYRNIHLHIVGSSPKQMYIEWYFNDLKKLVEENNLEKNVHFYGEIEDMKLIRSKMDIELMCAVRETFGRVTVEGMRSGLAVIGTNTGGTPEIIDDFETGLLYQQGSVQDLVSKIKLLVDDRKLLQYLGQNGYEYSKTHFTVQKNVSEVFDVLNSVVGEGKNERK